MREKLEASRKMRKEDIILKAQSTKFSKMKKASVLWGNTDEDNSNLVQNV